MDWWITQAAEWLVRIIGVSGLAFLAAILLIDTVRNVLFVCGLQRDFINFVAYRARKRIFKKLARRTRARCQHPNKIMDEIIRHPRTYQRSAVHYTCPDCRQGWLAPMPADLCE